MFKLGASKSDIFLPRSTKEIGSWFKRERERERERFCRTVNSLFNLLCSNMFSSLCSLPTLSTHPLHAALPLPPPAGGGGGAAGSICQEEVTKNV